MLDKKYLYSALAGAAVVGSIGAAALSFADTTGAQGTQPMHQPGVGGTVTAVDGNTVTVTGIDGKTYTIDASGASITKDETVGVSDIKVGDTIGARGTVSGQSVTATDIHDGKMPPMMGKDMWHHGPRPNDNDADDAPATNTAPTTQTTQQ